MEKKKERKQIVIFQTKSGAVELRGDWERETIWANLDQIADLFGVQKAAISKHFKNIFESKELSRQTTVSKMETVQIKTSPSPKFRAKIY